MKYDVHLYVPARVKIEGIEAASQEEAIRKADEQFDAANFFLANADTRESAQWDEGAPLGALVDEHGDTDFLKSAYHEMPGARAYIKVAT